MYGSGDSVVVKTLAFRTRGPAFQTWYDKILRFFFPKKKKKNVSSIGLLILSLIT